MSRLAGTARSSLKAVSKVVSVPVVLVVVVLVVVLVWCVVAGAAQLVTRT